MKPIARLFVSADGVAASRRRDLAKRQRHELLGSRLLAVFGKLERQSEATHLIAGRLKDSTPLLGKLVKQSQDFH